MLALLPGWLQAADAPYLRFRQLGIADGLSQNTVLTIAQDSTGFVWLGTRDGLARFDGRQIRMFREQANHAGGLRGQTINELLVDRDGQLWVGTSAGLFRYLSEQEAFVPVYLADDEGKSRRYSVYCLFQDGSGQLWMGNRQGLWRLDPGAALLRHNSDVPRQLVHAIVEPRPGQLWLAYPEALGQYEPASGRYSSVPVEAAAGAGERRALLATDPETLWLAGWGPGLSRMALSQRKIELIPLGTDPIASDFGLSLVRDLTGAVWLGSRYSGLLRYDAATSQHQVYRAEPGRTDSLSGDSVVALFIDRESLLWAGTEGDGVSFGASAGARFRLYGRPEHGIGDDNVRAVLQDRDHAIWLGTPTGLYRVESTAPNQVRRYPLPNAALNPGKAEAGPADMVHALAERRAGGFWIGGEKGLYRYEPKHDRLLPMREELPELPVSHQTSIINLLEDRDGALWLGTYGGGVYRWQPSRGALRHFSSNPDDEGASTGVLAYALFEDRRGQIWVGHENGLDRWMAETDQFDSLSVAEPNTLGLSHSVVQALAEDHVGRLWVGTQRGLNRLELDSGGKPIRVRQYDERDGLSSTMIYGLLTSSDGKKLWISSNGGLAELDVENDAIRLFDYRDGLQSNEFNGGATFRNGHGELFFGGVNGLTAFQPANLKPDPLPPTVVFTALRRFDHLLPLQPVLSARDRLHLNYRDSVLSFELAALRFVSADKNHFAYQVEGLDPDWIDLGNDNRFTLRNLPSGQYPLKVRAANGDGIWSEANRLLLAIAPPWWRSHWAYTAYVVAVISLMLLLLAWRTRDLRARAVKLEQTVRERTGLIEQQKQALTEQAERMQELLRLRELLFANISHEFRTPLTLILGPTEQLLSQTQEPASRAWLATIQRNGQRLLRMVEQLIQLARLQAGANPPRQWQAVTPLAEAIAESFRHLAVSKDLRFEAHIDGELWLPALPDALEQILLNLLSNACKYTPIGGEIALKITERDGLLLIQVRDSGIGIAPDQQTQLFQRFYRAEATHTEVIPGAGLGLALVKELVDSHDGLIRLDSQPGVGTHLQVELPGCSRIPPATPERGPPSELASPVVLWPDVPAEESVDNLLPANPDRPTLLIIEDNGELRRYLSQLLAVDYHCLEAADGEAGLIMARDWVPDLILCDVSLPIRDGFELARLIKDDERCCHIPFVFLTAHADQDSRLKGLRELADDYLSKPFDAAELRQRLSNLLELRALLRRRFSQQLLASPEVTTATLVSRTDDNAAESAPVLAEKDQRLLDRLQALLAQRHSELELDLTVMAAALAMSERQLQRKLQALLNLSPMEYLKLYRLERAAALLRAGQPAGRVGETVGFSSAAYFSRCFKARFGVAPGQYRQ